MKFEPDLLDGVNHITAYDATHLRVNAERFTGSVIVPWTGPPRAWDVRDTDGLAPSHFDTLLSFDPEVVIFGSGARLRFVSPALYRGLIERGIGVETMDSGAACRTYTVLANEGRRVVAAIVLSPAA